MNSYAVEYISMANLWAYNPYLKYLLLKIKMVIKLFVLSYSRLISYYFTKYLYNNTSYIISIDEILTFIKYFN